MYKDKVIIGDATLYLGDCLEILPTLEKVDAVIASPPYNIKGGTQKGTGMRSELRSGPRKINLEWYEDSKNENDYWEWINKIVGVGIDITGGGLVWINHKVRFENKEDIHPVRMIKYPIYSEIIWDRGGSIILNARKFAPSHESIWAFGKPNYWNNKSNTQMSVWRIAPAQDKEHPCPFPIQIPSKLIDASVPDNGTVVDPFMGSGTTGVACMNLGRKFIGIEIEEKYFNIACERIENAQRQGKLFD